MFNINTTVTEVTITRALSENLSEAEQKKIMLELEELGIDSVVIYKEGSNTYSINFTKIGSYDEFKEGI